MAKILFGVGVADARNKLGGHVFSKNRNGAYVRQKVSPSQPRTPAQLNVRSQFTALSKAWGGILTAAQRLGWNALATSVLRPDQFGNPQGLTGLQLYMSVNKNLFTIGQARLDDAPANQAVSGLTGLSVVATSGAGTIAVTFTPAPLTATEHLVVFATPGLSAGKTFVTSFLKLVKADAAGTTASPYAVGPAWVAKFGPLVSGQQVVVQAFVIDDVTGAASQPASTSTIVV